MRRVRGCGENVIKNNIDRRMTFKDDQIGLFLMYLKKF